MDSSLLVNNILNKYVDRWLKTAAYQTSSSWAVMHSWQRRISGREISGEGRNYQKWNVLEANCAKQMSAGFSGRNDWRHCLGNVLTGKSLEMSGKRGNFWVKCPAECPGGGNSMKYTSTGCPGYNLDFHAKLQTLLAAVMICATLVNRQTDRQLLTGYTISSASWAEKVQLKTGLIYVTSNWLNWTQ